MVNSLCAVEQARIFCWVLQDAAFKPMLSLGAALSFLLCNRGETSNKNGQHSVEQTVPDHLMNFTGHCIEGTLV